MEILVIDLPDLPCVGQTPWNAFAYVQIDYRHIRSTLAATSILLESDRDLPDIGSLGRSRQCFSSKAW
jgi:hypothetical protein